MKTVFLFILFLAMPFSVCAEDKIFLYDNYYYGMSFEEFHKTGDAQCDDYPDDERVCNRQGAPFAGMKWTQFFEFKNNGLTCVAFGQPASMAAVEAASAWLMKENYVVIHAQNGKESVNFMLLYDKNSQSQFQEEIDNFNSNLTSSQNLNAYLVKESVLKESKATDKLPGDCVIASLGGSKGKRQIFVCFELAKDVWPGSMNIETGIE